MSQIVHNPHQPPSWASKASTQIEAIELVGRRLTFAAVWIAAVIGLLALVIFVGWMILGIITGYVPLATFLGTGSVGGAVGTALTVFGKAKNELPAE